MKEGSFPALLPPRSLPLQAEHLQPPMACGIITKLMDEQKTREALDVLGELYLTGDHFPDKDAPAAVMPPVRPPAGGAGACHIRCSRPLNEKVTP